MFTCPHDVRHYEQPHRQPQEVNMLDIIGTMFVTALYAGVAGTLITLSRLRITTRLAAIVATAAWLTLTVAVVATGWLKPGVTGPVPLAILLFAGLLATMFAGWTLVPPIRSALLSVPLPALVAVHVGRVAGVFSCCSTQTGHWRRRSQRRRHR
jgi:hypothetical protein